MLTFLVLVLITRPRVHSSDIAPDPPVSFRYGESPP